MKNKKQYVLVWSPTALSQIKLIRKTMTTDDSQKYFKKIGDLIESIKEDPFKGLGKPEPLKYFTPVCWSRRINLKDKLIYRVKNNQIQIISILGHYNKRK